MRIQHWIYKAPLRLRSLFLRRQVEQELDDELQDHLDHKIEEFTARGYSPAEARRAAIRAMDGLTQRKEECRDTRGLNAIENTIQDFRFAVRVLLKSPGFTMTAVLTLALAIGANAVVFGILNGLLLRPANLPRAESLYGIEHGNEHSMYESYPDYLDLRDQNRSFEGLAAINMVQAGLDNGDTVSAIWGQAVSGNYFDALGLRPYVGQFFHGADEHGPNSAPLVVLGYGYWHTHMHDDRGVVGRVVELNKHPFTVVGVAPPEHNGVLTFGSASFFVPMVNQEQIIGGHDLYSRGVHAVFMSLGHLKPGVTPEQAVSDLNSIGGWLDKTYPKEHAKTTFKLARPGLYGNYMGGPVKAFMTALTMLAGLILLAACANLGSLFAARSADRSREIALRLALGSGRGRILRTLLTEALLIALMGGSAGLWASVQLLRGLSLWQPFPKFPLRVPVTPDARVYIVALVLALLSALLFALVPVRQVCRVDPYQIVKAGPGGTTGRRITVRDLLLVVQVAICAVLVTASLVAVRGLVRSVHGNFGFNPANAMLVNTDLAMAAYTDDKIPAMQKSMIEAFHSIPGVDSVGIVDVPPLYNGGGFSSLIYTDETTDLRASSAAATAMRYRISTDYLRAAGTVLLSGRTFTSHDDKGAPRVAIVNRVFAGRVFGAEAKALGRYFKMRDGARVQVVGIVEDGKYISLTEDADPALFLPILQSPSSQTGLVVRSGRDAHQLAVAIRAKLRELDPGLPAYVETWDQALDLALFPARIATMALGVLGLLGAMLSITGIFGMAAYSVSKRLRELGIRLALGAQSNEVLQAALGRAVKLLACGSITGMALGLMASRVLASLVYHATPRDPLVLGGVVFAMAMLGLLATWVPAQRALSLDPVTLLREE